jgi:hypothetical protein
MKTWASTALLLLACFVSLGAFGLPDRIGDFALLDSDGAFHQLSRYRHKDFLVVMAVDPLCKNLPEQLAILNGIEKEWTVSGVSFATVNADGTESLTALKETKKDLRIQQPLMVDAGQIVSATLKLSHAGEVVVLDPHRLTVLYRGPVSELGSVLADATSEPMETTMASPMAGCDLSFSKLNLLAETAPDYAEDVAPIIVEQCASCHREGGIGPFSMDSHLMLKGWSPMIREVLLTKRMPPTQVDPDIGHFLNARYLPTDQLEKLVAWIDAGSPRGTSAQDPLAHQTFQDRRDWQLGEPDYIIRAPKMEIPASGVLDYIDVNVDLPFDEDKWVKSVQFIAGDESVLHHLLAYVTGPNESFDGGESDRSSVARRFLEGYAPGKTEAMTFPENTGVYIPRGHKLSMQFHFTTNGRATIDETVLGLYLYDEPPKYENFTRAVVGNFRIPPFERNHKVAAAYTFNEDVVVSGLRAHMHFRGKDMKFSAEMPDGTITDLLSVPSYSYAWQPTYQLAEPAMLKAGTKVHVTGTFDNSEFNPANPDPSKELRFGLQSWNEMFMGYWTYHASKGSN